MQTDNINHSKADRGNSSSKSIADRENISVKGNQSVTETDSDSSGSDLFQDDSSQYQSNSDNNRKSIGQRLGSFNIIKKLFSLLKGAVGTAKSVIVTAFKVHTVAAIAAVYALCSVIIGIVAAISGAVSGVSAVIDYVPEPGIVLVRSAATGNSHNESSFEPDHAKREMARRIWSVMSSYDDLTDASGATMTETLTDPTTGVTEDVNKKCGLRPEQICAMLGVWEAESGLDPTAVESVSDEPFSIGNTKQQGTMFDFITDYRWSKNNDFFTPAEFKAGIGLAQWTDIRDTITPAGSTDPVPDPSWRFDIRNPGRNTKLITYAKLYGMKHYLDATDGWNGEKWIKGDKSTEGYWYDPRIQLAYALDESDVGDTGSGWLHTWGENASGSGNYSRAWQGDERFPMELINDQTIQGWRADFDPIDGYTLYIDRDIVNIGDMETEVVAEGGYDTGIGLGNGTGNINNFSSADPDKGVSNSYDSYYETNDTACINDTQYERWNVSGRGESTGAEWNRSDLVDSSAILRYDNVNGNSSYVKSDPKNTARFIALTYAELIADEFWHGRSTHGAFDYEGTGFDSSFGIDFLDVNRPPADLSHYQTYNSSTDTWSKIPGRDPAYDANKAAFKMYKSCLDYYYRYHLYRYMTMYYTAQFAMGYEGTTDPGMIEDRQRLASRWYQMWWDSSNHDGFAEPNIDALLAANPNGPYNVDYNDYFFKPEEGYAAGIMQGIERTKDALAPYEKSMKLYKYDADMSNNRHLMKMDTDEIAQAACMIAHPSISQSFGNNGTPCYQKIHNLVFGNVPESPIYGSAAGDHVYQSCDRSACTAIRWSGCDDNFPGGNTLVQMEYLCSSPRWTELDWGGDIENLQPGDVLIKKDSLAPAATYESSGNKHHILIYCGNKWCSALADLGTDFGDISGASPDPRIDHDICIVHGSFNVRSPGMGKLGDHRSFHAFRCTHPMRKEESIFNGISY